MVYKGLSVQKPLFKVALAGFIAVLLVFYSAGNARAGFFYFMEDWPKSGDSALQNGKTENLQTIALLDSSFIYDLTSSEGGGDITIINNDSLLPESGPLGTMADIGDEIIPNEERIGVYVVREGDNLSQIAKMFNVSVNTIIWANDIKRSDRIEPGQILAILPVSGVKYEVKKGDTVKSIAEKLNGDAGDIINFNDLTADGQLAAGQVIIVPNGEWPVPTYSTPSAGNGIRGASSPYYAGYYIRPINGGVKTQRIHGYNGVDLADSCGAPIAAAAAGNIIISKSQGWNGGYGNYIVISHQNGTQTLYAHLIKNIVFSGWNVAQGQIIGYVGSTGRSTGCHVHFEVRGAKNPF